MKVAVLIENPDQVPPKVRRDLITVSSANYEETYGQYFQLEERLILLVGPSLDADRMLKFVEDYRGDLAVYFTGRVSSVLLSRFNHADNRRRYQRKQFPELSRVEETVKHIKGFIQ